MTLSATDLKELELVLADRLYVQVASWNLYLGDAGLAQALAIECSARLVQIFWPLMSHWSPSSTARVPRFARSDPALGSE